MKTRIASSLALAAVIALGATGCSLFAPQGTLDPYAPSDGIDVTLDGVDVRNLMLISDEGGENFNVVFTGVNKGSEATDVRISFVDEGGAATANADFSVAPGTNLFGDLTGLVITADASDSTDGDAELGIEMPENVQIVSLPGVRAGATVTAYLQVAGGQDVQREVPVLDGTLAEYQAFVPPTMPVIVDDGAAQG